MTDYQTIPGPVSVEDYEATHTGHSTYSGSCPFTEYGYDPAIGFYTQTGDGPRVPRFPRA